MTCAWTGWTTPLAISCKPWQHGIRHGGRPSWKSWATPCPDCAHWRKTIFPPCWCFTRATPFTSHLPGGAAHLGGLPRGRSCPPSWARERAQAVFGAVPRKRPCAVLDLVEGYPEEGTLYLGLLELASPLQGKGLGTQHLHAPFPKRPGAAGFQCIRLACLEENLPGLAFWAGMGFEEEGPLHPFKGRAASTEAGKTPVKQITHATQRKGGWSLGLPPFSLVESGAYPAPGR